MTTPERRPPQIKEGSQSIFAKLKDAREGIGYDVLCDFHNLKKVEAARALALDNLSHLELFNPEIREQINNDDLNTSFAIIATNSELEDKINNIDGYREKHEIIFPLGERFIDAHLDEMQRLLGGKRDDPRGHIWFAIDKIYSLIE